MAITDRESLGARNASWYVAQYSVANNGAGQWFGWVAPDTTSDDIGDTADAAYPVPHGTSFDGTLTPSDVDWFSIEVPNPSIETSVVLTVTATAGATVTLHRPDGTIESTGPSPRTVGIGYPNGGRWTWEITGGVSAYSTGATLTCAPGVSVCDDLSGPSQTITPAWGGIRGGRLPTGTSTARYRVSLQQYQDLSVSIADTDPACQLQIGVIAPLAMRYFGTQPFVRWTNGGAAQDLAGTVVGPAGHVHALLAGDYIVEVRSRNPSVACSMFRLFAARGPEPFGWRMPSW